MTAWDVLIANSTAPAGSTAWVHLNNQSGGGGQTVYIPYKESFVFEDAEELILSVIEDQPINCTVGEDEDSVYFYEETFTITFSEVEEDIDFL